MSNLKDASNTTPRNIIIEKNVFIIYTGVDIYFLNSFLVSAINLELLS